MIKTKILCSLLIATAIQAVSFAQDDDKKKYQFVKTKTVNKTYTVNQDDKLSVSNSFGKVEVHTWNKNEIKVDVSVEVTANKETLAQKIFDGITISEKQASGDVSFKTEMKGNSNDKTDKSSMEVNYNIYMPATNQLKLSNEFGPTTIPDFKGKVDLTSKFGSINTGNLADVKSILVEFGKGDFESITNGDVTIKFSSASLGKLSGAPKLKLEFCSATKVNLDNGLSSLDVKASYSTINLKPSASLSASYSIATSFSSFKNTTGNKFDSDEDDNNDHGPKFDHQYDGKSGSGTVPVKIKVSFGKVILGEASDEDMKDDEKEKPKRKTT